MTHRCDQCAIYESKGYVPCTCCSMWVAPGEGVVDEWDESFCSDECAEQYRKDQDEAAADAAYAHQWYLKTGEMK